MLKPGNLIRMRVQFFVTSHATGVRMRCAVLDEFLEPGDVVLVLSASKHQLSRSNGLTAVLLRGTQVLHVPLTTRSDELFEVLG